MEKAPFTKKRLLYCPKCGSNKVERIYRRFLKYNHDFFDYIAGEFLECICQDCQYNWPQKVKHEED